MFSLTKYRSVFVGISAAIMVASVVAIGAFGLQFGIDFTGGSLMQVQVPGVDSAEALRASLRTAGKEPVSVQLASDGTYFLRFAPMTEEEHQGVLTALQVQVPEVEELRFESVGPAIGAALERQSTRALVLLTVLIAVYIGWAFRQVSKPVASWQYALVTALAALHDIVVPLGVFAVLGRVAGYQVDTAFVAAMLTILGYSINDTIVVFDRTRENLLRHRNAQLSFGEIVDRSVWETMGRSLNTTITTLLPLLAIALFGGEMTRPFVIALMVGIVAGAYSSIFLASPLLTYFVSKER